MTPGHPTADLIFAPILKGCAGGYAIIRDTDTADLRRALAALSTFRGPGTVARDVAMQVIRDELAERGQA